MVNNGSGKRHMETGVVRAPIDPRLDAAVRALSGMSDAQLEDAVCRRIQAKQVPGLPPLGRDEDPTQILTDIEEYAPWSQELRDRLRRVIGFLLQREAGAPLGRDPEVLAHLAYLAAAFLCADAIPSLTAILNQEEAATILLADGQSLRVFALRCFLPLAARYPERLPQDHSRLLERLLAAPDCEILSLTALVGLSPERRRELVTRVPAGLIDDAGLDARLRVAGFHIPARS